MAANQLLQLNLELANPTILLGTKKLELIYNKFLKIIIENGLSYEDVKTLYGEDNLTGLRHEILRISFKDEVSQKELLLQNTITNPTNLLYVLFFKTNIKTINLIDIYYILYYIKSILNINIDTLYFLNKFTNILKKKLNENQLQMVDHKLNIGTINKKAEGFFFGSTQLRYFKYNNQNKSIEYYTQTDLKGCINLKDIKYINIINRYLTLTLNDVKDTSPSCDTSRKKYELTILLDGPNMENMNQYLALIINALIPGDMEYPYIVKLQTDAKDAYTVRAETITTKAAQAAEAKLIEYTQLLKDLEALEVASGPLGGSPDDSTALGGGGSQKTKKTHKRKSTKKTHKRKSTKKTHTKKHTQKLKKPKNQKTKKPKNQKTKKPKNQKTKKPSKETKKNHTQTKKPKNQKNTQNKKNKKHTHTKKPKKTKEDAQIKGGW